MPFLRDRRTHRTVGDFPKANLPDAEHLRLALEFLNPDVGRDYLCDQGREELLAEFDRLTEEEAAALAVAA